MSEGTIDCRCRIGVCAYSENPGNLAPLFLRKEFQPHRAPFFRKRPVIIRPDLMTLGVGRGQNPWLRAAQEHVRHRDQPCRVVERAGAKVDGFRMALALAVNARTALDLWCQPLGSPLTIRKPLVATGMFSANALPEIR